MAATSGTPVIVGAESTGGLLVSVGADGVAPGEVASAVGVLDCPSPPQAARLSVSNAHARAFLNMIKFSTLIDESRPRRQSEATRL